MVHQRESTVEIALFQGSSCLALRSCSFKETSAQMLTVINQMLHDHQLTLTSLNFIAVNRGPGPYTTIRTIVTTANGLAYASNISLIGVESLATLVRSGNDDTYTHTFGLLQAYAGRVYWAQYDHAHDTLAQGVEPVTVFIEQLKHFLAEYPHARIRLVGQGFTIYHDEFMKAFETPFIPADIMNFATIDMMAAAALEHWQTGKAAKILFPAY